MDIAKTFSGDSILNAGLSTKLWVGLLAVFVISRANKYYRGVKAVSNLPGFRVPFYGLGLPGVVIPTSWWNPGYYFLWEWRDTLYKRFGTETISFVPFIAGPASFYTSNLDVARQVAGGGHKTGFIKPENASQIMLLWGMNLIAADGDMWRKHRRVMGPSFNNKLYDLVWKETLRTYHEMVSAEGWEGKDSIEVPGVQRLTFKLALLIIGKCGFGFSFDWANPPRSADGKMSVQETLRIVADHNMLLTLMPKWMRQIPLPNIRHAVEAFDLLTAFMLQQVKERKEEIHTKGEEDLERDVFTMLVCANEDEGSKFKLDDDELIGNVWSMLFAGHETTAHTLAATLGYLALHDDLQADVYKQIIDVIGNEAEPSPEAYSKLELVLAVFYEALRMFPAGHIMIRQAFEDTVLEIPKPHGEEGNITIPIEKGTNVVVDMVGVQRNPRYFDEPEKFKPSRWYGVPAESEMFSAFSIGPRACLGRKFAIVESVCFLAMLLRDYKVEPVLANGETREQWAKRVLDADIIITLGVKNVPVRFVRRK